ncbi:MAG: ABC transporter permease [Deltaproteobacteria bacterium]|nr:ABC transporter permease [Deltaproteobacteria bacterium]
MKLWSRSEREPSSSGVQAGRAVWPFVVLGLVAVASSIALSRGAGLDALDPTLRLAPPSLDHWLGTDSLGRDLLGRLIKGTAVSLAVAGSTAACALLIGAPLGVCAGYFGGAFDLAIRRFADGLSALPRIPVLLFVSAVDWGRSVPAIAALPSPLFEIVKLVIVLLPFAWVGFFRLARTTARSARERELVIAARAIGCSESRILLVHVLPLAIPPMLIASTQAIADLILYESTLSYLGFGVPPPFPSLGTMLSAHLGDLERAPLIVLAPGLMSLVLVASLFALGNEAARLGARA